MDPIFFMVPQLLTCPSYFWKYFPKKNDIVREVSIDNSTLSLQRYLTDGHGPVLQELADQLHHVLLPQHQVGSARHSQGRLVWPHVKCLNLSENWNIFMIDNSQESNFQSITACYFPVY